MMKNNEEVNITTPEEFDPELLERIAGFSESIIENFGEFYEISSDKIYQFAGEMKKVMNTVMDEIADILTIIQDIFINSYREEGAVYGDTPDGFIKWVNEKGKQARAEEAAEMKELQEWAGRLE